MKQTSIAVFDAYSLRLVRRLLVGRTSLRIILSDVGERRLGQKRRRLSSDFIIRNPTTIRCRKWRYFRHKNHKKS